MLTGSKPGRRGPTAQVVFGLLIVVVGILFTLDNLGLIDARDYLRFWPAGLRRGRAA